MSDTAITPDSVSPPVPEHVRPPWGVHGAGFPTAEVLAAHTRPTPGFLELVTVRGRVIVGEHEWVARASILMPAALSANGQAVLDVFRRDLLSELRLALANTNDGEPEPVSWVWHLEYHPTMDPA